MTPAKIFKSVEVQLSSPVFEIYLQACS